VTAPAHRARLRHLVERGARRALAAVGAPQQAGEPSADGSAPTPGPPPGAPARFAREFGPGALAAELQRASTLLYERLSDEEVAEVERRIADSPELRGYYAAAQSLAVRRHMVLAFGVWLVMPSVLEKTGLPGPQPPEDVHAMARGPTAAAGGLYEADLVADALASVGVDIADARTALDFGCSSGRVLRVLAAAYPQTEWHGCDPNQPAIAWAVANLHGINFFANTDAPPLPLADGALDLAFAISIWSHFSPALGLRWFEEMHRLIRPGGHLVCTTHGLTAINFYVIKGLRSPEQSDEIIGSLYRHGAWYAPEFGETGDWGVTHPDWGTAFLSPEWMLAQLCPRWNVLEFAPGRNQDNQDVYVLRRA
jgi:SAM-dependent methyltransferase